MGIATLLVLLCHGNYFTWPTQLSTLRSIAADGNVGVDIFLFLSAIGLYFSMKKNENILAFYRRRFSRIIPIYLVIAVPLYTILVFAFGTKNIRDYLYHLTQTGFLLPASRRLWTLWYIPFIVALYSFYPLIYFMQKHTARRLPLFSLLIAAALFLELAVIYFFHGIYASVEIALCRLPVFLIGCYCGPLVYEKKESNLKRISAICLTIFVITRILNECYIDRQSIWYMSIARKQKIFLAIGISCTCSLLFTANAGKDSILKRWLVFFGQHSLEIYMMHPLLMMIYMRLPLYARFPQFWVYYLAIVPLSVVLAVLARRLASVLTGQHPHK